MELIPAILASDEAEFRAKLQVAESLGTMIQLDVADGHFVPNSSWYDPLTLQTIHTRVSYILHLMVSDPTAYIGASKDIHNVTRILWHIEVAIGHDVLINWCHTMKREAGLAISPETPVSRLAPFAETADEILVLGVPPGFSGQRLLPQTIETVREIRERWPGAIIGFDGGITAEAIPRLREAGVQRLYVGSAIFGAKRPKDAFHRLLSLC